MALLEEACRRWRSRRRAAALFDSTSPMLRPKDLVPILVAAILVASSVFTVFALRNAVDRSSQGFDRVRIMSFLTIGWFLENLYIIHSFYFY